MKNGRSVSKMVPESYIYIYIYIHSSPVAAPLSIRGSTPRSRIYIYIYIYIQFTSRRTSFQSTRPELPDGSFRLPWRAKPVWPEPSQGARLPQMASPHHRRTTFWRWEGPGWNCWPSQEPQGLPRLFLMMSIWGPSWTPKTTPLDPLLRVDTL